MLKGLKGYLERRKEVQAKKAAEFRISVSAAFERGTRLFELGEHEEALKDFLQCGRNPKLFGQKEQIEVLLSIGKCYFKLGRLEDADNFFGKALSLDKNGEAALQVKGVAHLESCSLEVEQKVLKRQVDDARSKMLWALTGDEKLRLGDRYSALKKEHDSNERNLKKALQCFEKLAKLDVKNPEYLYHLGVCFFFTGHKREAVDIFDAALRLRPGYPNRWRLALFEKIRQEQQIFFVEKTGEKSLPRYKTDRGVFVRSKAEALIDNFYFHRGIKARYEPTLTLEGKEIHPDWQLKPDLVHEHLGSPESARMFEFKKRLYELNGISVITTTAEDEEDIEGALQSKLSGHFDFKAQ